MDDREDGEVSSSEDEAITQETYNPVHRPVVMSARTRPLSDMSEDESSNDSDSSLDQPMRKRKCGGHTSQRPVAPIPQNGAKKRNNIWANVLQEESLMQTMADVEVKTVRKTDRNVESYQIPVGRGHFSDSDSEKDKEKLYNRAKRFHLEEDTQQPKVHSLTRERHLPDIAACDEMTNEELGKIIAENLKERKPELIIKILQILGKDLILRLYEKTQLVENNGGVMVMNGSRRRTSGGVFLYLLKTFENVTKDHLANIFIEDKTSEVFKKRKRDGKKRRRARNDELFMKEITEIDEASSKDSPEENGGIKCPGSTPVPSPQDSCSEDISRFSTEPVHLVEACEKAAMEIEGRI